MVCSPLSTVRCRFSTCGWVCHQDNRCVASPHNDPLACLTSGIAILITYRLARKYVEFLKTLYRFFTVTLQYYVSIYANGLILSKGQAHRNTFTGYILRISFYRCLASLLPIRSMAEKGKRSHMVLILFEVFLYGEVAYRTGCFDTQQARNE